MGQYLNVCYLAASICSVWAHYTSLYVLYVCMAWKLCPGVANNKQSLSLVFEVHRWWISLWRGAVLRYSDSLTDGATVHQQLLGGWDRNTKVKVEVPCSGWKFYWHCEKAFIPNKFTINCFSDVHKFHCWYSNWCILLWWWMAIILKNQAWRMWFCMRPSRIFHLPLHIGEGGKHL